MGTPTIPLPPPDSGGVYIWVDSSGWNIANHIYSQGNSFEQFHGSVLAMLGSPPEPGVNVFTDGFELFGDTTSNLCYKQNDRWGWFQWAENLYEIWWDVSTREWQQGEGDPNDFMVINIAGCAIDFNVWSSGHGVPFNTDQVYLGVNMIRLSDVPGFVDTYPGITDPYQSQAGSDPENDPNITVFALISGTGNTYNIDGSIVPGQTYPCGQVLGEGYGDRFAGPFVYEGNGIQFSSSCLNDPCQFNNAPAVSAPGDTSIFVCALDEICLDGFGYGDPDDNLLSVEVSGGVLNGTIVCFTPVKGANTITIIATDECGAADTAVTVVTVDLNDAPVASSPDDTTMFVCDLSQICLSGFAYSDADGNISSVDVTGGILNSGEICFTPVEGANAITLIVTDECGAADTAVTVVTVDLNEAPVASSPDDTTMFVCDLSQICLSGFAYSDADGNITSVDVTGGTLNNGEVCFTPMEGANAITLVVTDGCGAADTAVTVVTVDLNEAPVANCPGDTAVFFVCEVSQICIGPFSSGDNDGNLDTAYIATDGFSGTFDGTSFCFTPDSRAVYQIRYIAVDQCGEADTCAVNVDVQMTNEPPTVECPGDTALVICDLNDICLPGFGYGDGNNNIETVDITGGTYSDGSVCFTPSVGQKTISITVTDSCGLTASCTTIVSITMNNPPAVTCMDDTTMIVDDLSQICLPGIGYEDPDGNIASVVLEGGVMVSGQVCFTPVPGINNIKLIVTDDCGAADSCEVNVTVGYCAYMPGDANADFSVNGLDITIMVNFFKGGPPLPDTCDCRPDVADYPFFGSGDTNGDCAFNGLDVTYLFNYLTYKVDAVLYCPSCPPTGGWVASDENGNNPRITRFKEGKREKNSGLNR